MGILSDDSRSVFEIGEEVLANEKEEANTPSSIISMEDAKSMGMIQDENNTELQGDKLQYGKPDEDKKEREFEKLSVGDSWKDAGKAVASEAGKILLPNRDNAAGRFVSDTFFEGRSEDDIWNYQAKTHFGEAMRGIYEWGVPTLATMGAGTAIGVGLKATKVAKLQKAGSFFTKYLGFEDVITKQGTTALQKAGIFTANSFLTGSISGGLVDFVKADHDRIANNLEVDEINHPLQAAFIRSLQDDGTDNQFTMRTKSLVEGFFMGGASGIALGSLFKIAGKTLNHFNTAKAGLNASTKEEAEALGKQYVNEEIDLQKSLTTLDKVKNVNDIYDKAVEQGVDGRDIIKAKFSPLDSEEMVAMYDLREQGEQIFVHEDGTWDIAINNWEDAYKVSEDSYKAQLAAKDVDRAGDTAISESNKAVETTWRDRGWIASGENLVETTDKGVVKPNQKVANNIVKIYKDKWNLPSNIKVQFIDGNGGESKTLALNNTGKKVKNNSAAIKKQENKIKELKEEISNNKDLSNKIDKKKIEIKELENQIILKEGGNDEPHDTLDILKEKLAVANKELEELNRKSNSKKLQNQLEAAESKLAELKSEPEINPDAIIQIDKNSKTPYADLRAELEHARDISTKSVPKDANVEGSGVHFSRYKGDNEAEVAGGYTYGKSVARAKRNGIDTLNSDADMLKYKQEVSANGTKESTTTNSEGMEANRGTNSEDNERIRNSYERRSYNGSRRGLVKEVYSLNDDSLNKESFPDYNLLENTEEAANEFRNALIKAKDALGKKASSVHVYSTEEYSQMKLLLSEDGLSGVAIKPDGDIVSVFSAKEGSGRNKGLMNLAIKLGGNKLDAFDTYLPKIYKKFGFVETGRDKWNEQYKPEGWDKEYYKDYNNGEPDVVYMQLKEATQQQQPKQQTYEQLKLNFETAEDIGNAVARGDIEIKSFDDVENVVNNLVEKDSEINSLSVKDMENDTDFQAEILNSDNVVLTKAAANNDKKTLLAIFKKEMALFKHLEGLINKIMDSSIETPLEEIEKVLTQINRFGIYMKGIASAAGTGLGQHAYFKEIFNKSLSDVEAYQTIKKGALELANIIKGSLGDVLNFTRGHKISSKDFDKLFGAMLEDERTAGLMNDKEIIQFIRQTIQDASDKGVNLSVDDMVQSIIRKANEDSLRQIQSVIKLSKNTKEAIKNTINWNRELSAYYVHNLLSGVGSTGRNIASGGLNTLYYPMRKIFAGMDIWTDSQTKGELFSEGVRTYANMLVSAKEAFELAVRAFKKGDGKFNSTVRDTLNSTKDGRNDVNWIKDFDEDNWSVGDYTRGILSFMSRVMGASDEFLKQLNYRSIVRAKADNYINQDMFKGLSKENRQKTYDNYFKSQFTSEGLPTNTEALSEAQAITYQQNLNGTVYNNTTGMYDQVRNTTAVMNFGDWLHKQSNKSVFMKIPFPFIKTGMNILNQNLEHNIFYNALSSTQRAILTSNSKEGALLRSQCFLGFAGLAMGAGLTLAGNVTGSAPKDKTTRQALYRTGWRPYSVKVGDKWVSYTGIEPLHTMLGFAADSTNLMMSVINPEEEISIGEQIQQGLAVVTANFLDKAAFRAGITQMNILFNPDNQDASLIEKELANVARGFLPLSSLGRNVGTLIDTNQKTPTTLSERIFDRYFRTGLGEYRRNVFGEKQDTHTLALVANYHNADESFEMEELDRLAQAGFNPKEISKAASQDTTYKFKDFKNKDGYSMYETMMDRLSTLEIDGYTLREAVRNRMMESDYASLVDGSKNEPDAQKFGYKYTVKDPTKINALREVFSEYIAEAKRQVIEDEGYMFFNKDGKTLTEALDEAREAKINMLNEAALTEHNADKIQEY